MLPQDHVSLHPRGPRGVRGSGLEPQHRRARLRLGRALFFVSYSLEPTAGASAVDVPLRAGGAGLGSPALHSDALYQQLLERILINAKTALLRADSRAEVVAVVQEASERLTALESRVRRDSPSSSLVATIDLERRRLQKAR